MTVIATKGGKFAPRDGSEPFTLKPGDQVPALLADAALAQGWGRKEAAPKKVAKAVEEPEQDD